MGNKLCKKKVDGVDTVDNSKTTNTFDRIINRLHLRPNTWKSESHLNQKQVNRCEANPKDPTNKENITQNKQLSKSTDWTEVALEVPDKEPIHLRDPKLSIIFNNEEGTPTPPPRKHKKGFREKIEAVAKSGLQALQSKKPVEEEVCVKKKINFNCPYCEGDESAHNRDHKHHHHDKKHGEVNEKKLEEMLNNNPILLEKKNDKDSKRRKNLSVVSLPNYNDLKMTVTTFDDIDKKPNDNKRNSITSLNDTKKITTTASTGKLDNYITRCRSFGSLIPQQLMGKLKTRKVPDNIESDDSFGALEDWDLRIIEHYNPKDASLPRARKVPDKNILSDLESMIVQEEDIEKPTPPVRRSESLVKKMNREASQTAAKRSNEMLNNNEVIERPKSITPPPSPEAIKEARLPKINFNKLPTEENGKVEHSSLMKILEEYSIRDKHLASLDGESIPHIDDDVVDERSTKNNSNYSSLTPSLMEFEKNLNTVEDFINAEKINTNNNLNVPRFSNAVVS